MIAEDCWFFCFFFKVIGDSGGLLVIVEVVGDCEGLLRIVEVLGDSGGLQVILDYYL